MSSHEIFAMAVGAIVGTILTTVVHITNRIEMQVNTVPVEQCIAAILSIQKRGE